MKCFPGLSLLLASLLVPALLAGQVEKGGDRPLDEVMNQGFEDDGWQLTWTLHDGDGSGTSWARLSQDEYFIPLAGSSAIGCRYNADGSANDDWLISPALRTTETATYFDFSYRSQDPLYPESMEVLHLTSDAVLSQEELVGELQNFTLLDRFTNIPIDWQSFRHSLEAGDESFHYFAIRCISEDRFVLLVDKVAGNMVIHPAARWALGTGSARQDFGLSSLDSTLSAIRFHNLDLDSALNVRLVWRPGGPFVLDMSVFDQDEGTSFTLAKDSHVELVTGSWPLSTIVDSDTSWATGSWSDSLVLELEHLADGSLSLVTIPFTVGYWWEEANEELALFEDFETDSLRGGWSTWADVCGTPADPDPCGNDDAGWRLGSRASSANFTIPAGSGFAYLNSDGRGAFAGDGSPLSQVALLGSPWIMSHDESGAPFTWLLAWEQVYNGNAGGEFDLFSETPGGSRELLHRGIDNAQWENRSMTLQPPAESDSFRLVWRFMGTWSYGVAIDDVALLEVEGFPAMAAPGPAEERPESFAMSLAPNPFNPVTTTRFVVPSPGEARIEVYNLRGQRVLQTGRFPVKQGFVTRSIDFTPLASGIYLVRLEFVDGAGNTKHLLKKATYLR